jgi:hypothetical protein
MAGLLDTFLKAAGAGFGVYTQIGGATAFDRDQAGYQSTINEIKSRKISIQSYLNPGQTIDRIQRLGTVAANMYADRLKQAANEAYKAGTEAITAYETVLYQNGQLRAALTSGNAAAASRIGAVYAASREFVGRRKELFVSKANAFDGLLAAYQAKESERPGASDYLGAVAASGKEAASAIGKPLVQAGEMLRKALPAWPLILGGVGLFVLYTMLPKGRRSE